jgi:hypothetical protein
MLPDDTREAASRLVNKKKEILEAKYGNYGDNLNEMSKAIDSITACFELNHGTADEIAFPLIKMYEAIRNKDYDVLDLNIQVLQNESKKLPEHIKLSVDPQIELLNIHCRKIIDYSLESDQWQ